MSDSDAADRIRLLTPDPPAAEHLNTAGKRNHPIYPYGVDQSRAL